MWRIFSFSDKGLFLLSAFDFIALFCRGADAAGNISAPRTVHTGAHCIDTGGSGNQVAVLVRTGRTSDRVGHPVPASSNGELSRSSRLAHVLALRAFRFALLFHRQLCRAGGRAAAGIGEQSNARKHSRPLR